MQLHHTIGGTIHGCDQAEQKNRTCFLPTWRLLMVVIFYHDLLQVQDPSTLQCSSGGTSIWPTVFSYVFVYLVLTEAILPRVVHSYHDHLILECSGFSLGFAMLYIYALYNNCIILFAFHKNGRFQSLVSFGDFLFNTTVTLSVCLRMFQGPVPDWSRGESSDVLGFSARYFECSLTALASNVDHESAALVRCFAMAKGLIFSGLNGQPANTYNSLISI